MIQDHQTKFIITFFLGNSLLTLVYIVNQDRDPEHWMGHF